MSYIILGNTESTENIPPEELKKLLNKDFMGIFFSDDTIMECFHIYYNNYTGEITVEYYKDGDVEVETTTSISRVVELYNDYFYKLL